MKRSWLIGLGVMVLCSSAMADDDHIRAKRLHQSGDIVAVEQILNQVRQHYSGRVLEVDLEENNGLYLYEIEAVDSSGDVRKLYFDAKTGKPVKGKWKE